MKRSDRIKLLQSLLSEKILVLDGATGTALQNKNLSADDFGSSNLEGCNEHLILTRPDLIKDIHNLYLDAGADIIKTNTFGGSPIVLKEYSIDKLCYEINKKNAEQARYCADSYSKLDLSKPRFVAGSMGPTTKAISVTGGVNFDQLIQNYYQHALGLYDGGIDYFLLETCNDTRNIKAAIQGIEKLFSEKEDKIPIAISITIEPIGTMLAGQSVEALVASLGHLELLYLGLNCATGPELMTEHIRTMSNMANTYTACVPNAGLPDENGNYLETPEMMANSFSYFIDKGWINLIGGCCGTTAAHIRAMSQLVDKKVPRNFKKNFQSFLSGIDFLEISDERRPVLVGERTNVIGSKKFKNLITNEQYDAAAEIGKKQVKNGAGIIDVCLANPDRNELDDMKNFLEKLIQKVRVPLMIDSTDEKVIEAALTYSQGKAIINSINLEEGEKRFEKVVPLAKKYGAALVVGTIDDHPDQGMAITKERKLEIAKKSYQILIEKYKFNETDIYWDTLVFPCATGDKKYLGSAKETIEALKIIKSKYPKTKTLLGLSNISFGLPTAGREVLNSVFLYHCVQAGLNLAIVNTQKLKRYSMLTEEEIQLAENLLFSKNDNAIIQFTDYYRDKKTTKSSSKTNLPIATRLSSYIIDGIKEGLIEDLDKMVQKMSPIEIVNGPLMDGMREVGNLFNQNKLIVAEVLQSAEVMKSAVSHLEPLMDTGDTASKGKLLLATVKGDVHDIGKNLVDIVLSNNGFQVINLGIKVTSKQLIQAVKDNKPDLIGLSALLIKSAQQMALTIEDLARANIALPILVGGAALSNKYVTKNMSPVYPSGEVFYAKDAMEGLQLANDIRNKQITQKSISTSRKEKNLSKDEDKLDQPSNTDRSLHVSNIIDIPSPPDFERHVIKNTPVDIIWNYINPFMLYGKHLGIKKALVNLLIQNNIERLSQTTEGKKALEIHQKVERVKNQYKKSHLLPAAIYHFFRCYSEKNTIFILHPKSDKILARFVLPRQNKRDGLCVSDYVTPKNSNVIDNMAMFIVTVGENILEEVTKLKNQGHYLDSHILSALTLEMAEGYAEYIHRKIRSLWGIQDQPDLKIMELLLAKYRGKRYSFGYPACPDLENQKILFDLLSPVQEIGVKLTDNCMMDPEASVSAMVFHHNDATYFSVS